ncbi:hypothetical protein GCM10009751_01890 [Myceligenerans crystallogenes]|uniref:Uncharacterized protein n=1 Tax=Myceligenerans crystallogenes TaxID=316335 RepID=A0ABN2N2E3_9MICO
MWLLVLPLVVALAAAAWSFRFVNIYRHSMGPVERVDDAGPGEVAHFAEDYFDALGLDDPALANTWVHREVDVRVLGVEPVEQVRPAPTADVTAIPQGAAAWRVDLELAAEPGTDLLGCDVILVTPDGTRYGDDGAFGSDPLGHDTPCLPADDYESVAPEAGTWKVSTVVLTREGETVETIWFTFGGGRYVTLAAPAA